MQKTILSFDPDDNYITDIRCLYYDSDIYGDCEECTLKLTPSEAAANWWVKRLKNLARFMAENGKKPKYAIYLCYLAMVRNFTERDWREVYLCLAEVFKLKFEHLPKGCNAYYQGASAHNHDAINIVLFEIAKKNHPEVPHAMLDVDLTTGYQIDADTYIFENEAIEKNEDERRKIQDSYTGSYEYDYIVTGDEGAFAFSNLVKGIILKLANDEDGNLNKFSINRIRTNFCRGYIDFYGIDVDEKRLFDEFDHAFFTVAAHELDIKIKDNKYVYYPNPLDEVEAERIFNEYPNAIDSIYGVICSSVIARKKLATEIGERQGRN